MCKTFWFGLALPWLLLLNMQATSASIQTPFLGSSMYIEHAKVVPTPIDALGVPRRLLAQVGWWEHRDRSRLFTYRISLGDGRLSYSIEVDRIEPIDEEDQVQIPENIIRAHKINCKGNTFHFILYFRPKLIRDLQSLQGFNDLQVLEDELNSLWTFWAPHMQSLSSLHEEQAYQALQDILADCKEAGSLVKLYCPLMLPRISCAPPSLKDIVNHFIITRGKGYEVILPYVSNLESLSSIRTDELNMLFEARYLVPYQILEPLLQATIELHPPTLLRKWAAFTLANPNHISSPPIFTLALRGLRDGNFEEEEWVPFLWNCLLELNFDSLGGTWEDGPFPRFFKIIFTEMPTFFASHHLVSMTVFGAEYQAVGWISRNLAILDVLTGKDDSGSLEYILCRVKHGDADSLPELILSTDFFLSLTDQCRMSKADMREDLITAFLQQALVPVNEHVVGIFLSLRTHHAFRLWVRGEGPMGPGAIETLKVISRVRWPTIYELMLYSALLVEDHADRPHGFWKSVAMNNTPLALLTELFHRNKEWVARNNHTQLVLSERLSSLDVTDQFMLLRCLVYLLYDVPFEESTVVLSYTGTCLNTDGETRLSSKVMQRNIKAWVALAARRPEHVMRHLRVSVTYESTMSPHSLSTAHSEIE